MVAAIISRRVFGFPESDRVRQGPSGRANRRPELEAQGVQVPSDQPRRRAAGRPAGDVVRVRVHDFKNNERTHFRRAAAAAGDSSGCPRRRAFETV